VVAGYWPRRKIAKSGIARCNSETDRPIIMSQGLFPNLVSHGDAAVPDRGKLRGRVGHPRQKVMPIGNPTLEHKLLVRISGHITLQNSLFANVVFNLREFCSTDKYAHFYTLIHEVKFISLRSNQ
jgi:hypothetical protein